MRNLKPLFRLVCHQQPKRSYHMCGETLFVCTRCLGLYLGFLITFAFLLVLYEPFSTGLQLALILFFLMPMGIDGGTQLIGWRESSNNIRYFTGYIAGIGVAYLVSTIYTMTYLSSKSFIYINLFDFSNILFLIPMFLIYPVLKKYNNSENKYLKSILNFSSAFALAILLLTIVIVWSDLLLSILLNKPM